MGLPAYLLEQPKTNPTDVLARQIRNLGLDVELTRNGKTLTVRNLELLGNENESDVLKAIRLIATHADLNKLSVDAIVYPIQDNVISRYETAGFLIHVMPSDDADEDAYTLLRRPVRS
jgi:hypothetical protein